MGALIDLTGKEFGRLVVIAKSEKTRHGRAYWSCHCTCGNTVVVCGAELRKHETRSCGCLRDEMKCNLRHGQHGTCEYSTWMAMRQRCGNPKNPAYKNYGGRGISVCERWMSFDSFLADMGKCPEGCSIDRINNNGNYEPSNCRWATSSEQARNTRVTTLLEFCGESKALVQWAEEFGIHPNTIRSRLRLGWTIEEAITTTKRPQGIA